MLVTYVDTRSNRRKQRVIEDVSEGGRTAELASTKTSCPSHLNERHLLLCCIYIQSNHIRPTCDIVRKAI